MGIEQGKAKPPRPEILVQDTRKQKVYEISFVVTDAGPGIRVFTEDTLESMQLHQPGLIMALNTLNTLAQIGCIDVHPETEELTIAGIVPVSACITADGIDITPVGLALSEFQDARHPQVIKLTTAMSMMTAMTTADFGLRNCHQWLHIQRPAYRTQTELAQEKAVGKADVKRGFGRYSESNKKEKKYNFRA